MSIEYAADHEEEATGCEIVDWREIIYQMALDYRKHMHDAATPDAEFYSIDELLPMIAANNPNDYPTGNTGYEQYYVDLEGFWRLLYNPDYKGTFTPISKLKQEDYNKKNIGEIVYFTVQTNADYNSHYDYFKLQTGSTTLYEYAGKLSESEFIQNRSALYRALDPKRQQQSYNSKIKYYSWDHDDYYTSSTAPSSIFKYWNKEVFTNPENLLFWFDFIDAETNSELSMYAVDNIGLRSMAKNDSAVKAVAYKEVPNVLFVVNPTPAELAQIKTDNPGYTVLSLSENLKDVFRMSVQGKSAKDEIDTQIYNKACCCESITINSVPIYHIEPNAKIYIKDTKAGINGAYLAERMSINLAYNGMMNITATKIIDRII